MRVEVESTSFWLKIYYKHLIVTEASPDIRMSGTMPPMDASSASGPKFHQVILENNSSLVMYNWVQQTALEHLPGRVPADQSGFHFPHVMAMLSSELCRKRPTEYTYNAAFNVIKQYLIAKTVTNCNSD